MDRVLHLVKVECEVNEAAVRPAMMYGLKMMSPTKRQDAELEEAELKMLCFLMGVSRLDKT